MSDDRKDSGAVGVIGAAGAAAGAGYVVNNRMGTDTHVDLLNKKGIFSAEEGKEIGKGAQAIKDAKKAGFDKLEGDKLTAHQALQTADGKGFQLGKLKPEQVESVTFTKTEKGYNAVIATKGKGAPLTIEGLKSVPKEAEAAAIEGKPIKGEQLSKLFGEKSWASKVASGAERELATANRQLAGSWNTFKNMGWKRQGAVVAAAIGTAVVTKWGLDNLLGGGQHASQLAARDAQQPAQGPAVG